MILLTVCCFTLMLTNAVCLVTIWKLREALIDARNELEYVISGERPY